MNHTVNSSSIIFQKEEILKRLRNQVVKLWGLQDSEINHLDPIIDLLLGACAVEFERTGNEIAGSDARKLERLAHLMVPEVYTNAKPSHSILHCNPDQAVLKLRVEDQFMIEKEVHEGNKILKSSLVFSPVIPAMLLDVSVACQVDAGKLTWYEDPLNKGEIIPGESQREIAANTIWLGLKVNQNLDSFQGLSIYFDWKNEPYNERHLAILQMARIYHENELLEIGDWQNQSTENTLEDSDPMTSIEKHVLHLYKSNICTIISSKKIEHGMPCPREVKEVFSKEKIARADGLVWLKICFPVGMERQALNEIYCTVNCIPVLNRTLHSGNRPYPLSAKLNCIPIYMNNHFLSLRKVYSTEREFFSSSLKKIREVEDGTFSLRHGGMTRFDQRDASLMLDNLFDLLRDEAAAFSALGEQQLSVDIKSLQQILSRLQSHVDLKIKSRSSKSNLLLFTKEPEDVYVEFWSCDGAMANKFPPGTKVFTQSFINAKKESMMLMTSTRGGTDPLNEEEKLHAFKYALLARQRVGTTEDIKAACFARLGHKLQKVEIRKGVKIDHQVRKGFIRTLDIYLKPSKEFNEINWNEECKEMKSYLEKVKMFLTPVEVYKEEDQAAYVA